MSNSDFKNAVLLALRVIIFSTPLLFGAFLFELAMYRTGDSWPISKVIAAQEATNGESLLGRGYFSQQYNLSKSEMVKQRRPRILALGSSRVMEFRALMFHPYENDFYNGGGMIQNVNDLAAYARLVRDGKLPKPQVVIVGIDPWWVSEATDSPTKPSWLEDEVDAVYKFSSHVEGARSLLRTGKSNFPWRVAFGNQHRESPQYRYPSFGITAIASGIGERYSDGSFLYTSSLTDFIKHPVYHERLTPPVLDQVKGTFFLFAPSSRVERVRAEMLVQSLVMLKTMGIEVYAFEPPFVSEVKQALDESQPLATFWTEYKESLPAQLEQAGIHCLLVAAPKDYGLDDRYMLDGIHPGEVFDSYIVESLVKQAPRGSLLAALDLDSLKALRQKEGVIPLSFNPPAEASNSLNSSR
jgi:hypothetical protein